ncbi:MULTISPECIES: PepSY domain-containing protein [Salinicola]|uniref:PepSY domain-containing protein n=1 Tax=Salinicola TaxID=404432 RepID=UPI0008DCC2C1|nr:MULTISPECIES: PepSY domain-containing protein [Salinicola]MDF3918624.1 PepSY domain-containing protein [Salinicola salarius]OHZ04874.1 peptidase [Salinicola sp. MIT1003]
MKFRNLLMLLTLPLMMSGALVPVSADGDNWRDLHKEVKEGHLVGIGEIMDWLEARYEGQILEVELEQEGDRIEYEVEMIGPRGQVVEFEFDATNGELLSVEGVDIAAMKKSP